MDIKNSVIAHITEIAPSHISKDQLRWYYESPIGRENLDHLEAEIEPLWKRYVELVDERIAQYPHLDRDKLMNSSFPKNLEMVSKLKHTKEYYKNRSDGPDKKTADKIARWDSILETDKNIRDAFDVLKKMKYKVSDSWRKTCAEVADSAKITDDDRPLLFRMGFPKRYAETVDYCAYNTDDNIYFYELLHQFRDMLNEIDELHEKVLEKHPEAEDAISDLMKRNIEVKGYFFDHNPTESEDDAFREWMGIKDEPMKLKTTPEDEELFRSMPDVKDLIFKADELRWNVLGIVYDGNYSEKTGWTDPSIAEHEFEQNFDWDDYDCRPFDAPDLDAQMGIRFPDD